MKFLKRFFSASESAKEVINELKEERDYLKGCVTYGCRYDDEEEETHHQSHCENCGAPLNPNKDKCEYCNSYIF